MRIHHYLGAVLTTGCLLLSNCSMKKESASYAGPAPAEETIPQSAPSPVAASKQKVSDSRARAEKRIPKKEEMTKMSVGEEFSTDKTCNETPDLQQVFAPVKAGAWGRKLSYTMDLTYRCDKFLDARRQLMSSIPRYGFILSSETSIDEYSSALNAVFKIHVDSLYSFIDAIQSIGYLQHEQINGVDHTGDIFFNVIQMKRQRERVSRKADIVSATYTNSRNFDNRENELVNQEDRLDQVEFEKWQYNDRIEWIEVRMQLVGPQKVYQENVSISVPQYKRHFYGMLSGLLSSSVVLIYILPYVLIVGGVSWITVFLIRRFRNRGKKAA